MPEGGAGMKLYIRDKAAILLGKLYSMRKMDFQFFDIDDMMKRATPDEIEFYYHYICEKGE